MRRKLRVGVLVNSTEISLWMYRILETVRNSEYAEIVLVLVCERVTAGRKSGGARIAKCIRNLLYLLQSRLDATLRPATPDPFVPTEVLGLFPGVPVLRTRGLERSGRVGLDSDIIQRVRSERLDVLLDLGLDRLDGEILRSTTLGVWAHEYADRQMDGQEPAGYWAVMEGRQVSASSLVVVADDPHQCKVLVCSWSQTDPMFVQRHLGRLSWKMMWFAPRMLQRAYEQGCESFTQHIAQTTPPPFPAAANHGIPGNAQALTLVARKLAGYARSRITDLLYMEQWQLLFRFGDDHGACLRPSGFSGILPSKNRYWADPFPVHKDGRHYVFYEDYDVCERKGTISVAELGRRGEWREPTAIMVRDYHLSYPFVFLHEGVYYMVPESSGNRTVDLYECIQFPDEWRFVRHLMSDVTAVDATLVQHRGLWWLFTNIRQSEGESELDDLHVFYSDDLLFGLWKPHPKNPVVSDVRGARPAGRISAIGDTLYRPSQDCGVRYGYGVKINRVLELSETNYREECVNEIEPPWHGNLLGIHTLNQTEGLAMMDSLVRRPRYWG